MAFPKTFLGFPIGWDDRGKVDGRYEPKDKVTIEICHGFCNTTAHIGIEDGIPFQFCPLCLIKLTTPKNDNQKT